MTLSPSLRSLNLPGLGPDVTSPHCIKMHIVMRSSFVLCGVRLEGE